MATNKHNIASKDPIFKSSLLIVKNEKDFFISTAVIINSKHNSIFFMFFVRLVLGKIITAIINNNIEVIF